MSNTEYSNGDDDGPEVNSTAYLKIEAVKCNTPRARFDVTFYPCYIELIQFNVNKDAINSHRINKSDIKEMYRLPVDEQQIFIVLHLKHDIVGKVNRFISYDFMVFSFLKNEYIEVEPKDSKIADVFRRKLDYSGLIVGKTVDIFETMIKYVFDKPVNVPTDQKYISESVIKCTFNDNNDHYLYPLKDQFLSLYKYCQCMKLTAIKNVNFVKGKGRAKTFDFIIYPSLNNIDNKISKSTKCWYFEFKSIDLKHYDWLHKYCKINKLQLKNDPSDESRGSADDGDKNTGNLRDIIGDVDFRAPDPHMLRCQTEGKSDDSSEDISSCESKNDREIDKNIGNLRNTIVNINYKAPDPHLSRCKREARSRRSIESTSKQNDDRATQHSGSDYNDDTVPPPRNLGDSIADINYKPPDPYLLQCKREGKFRSSLKSASKENIDVHVSQHLDSDCELDDENAVHSPRHLRDGILDINYEAPDPHLLRCKREGKRRRSFESTSKQNVMEHSDECSSSDFDFDEKNTVHTRDNIVNIHYEAPDPYLSRCKREGKYRGKSTNKHNNDDKILQQKGYSSSGKIRRRKRIISDEENEVEQRTSD